MTKELTGCLLVRGFSLSGDELPVKVDCNYIHDFLHPGGGMSIDIPPERTNQRAFNLFSQ